MMFFSQSKKENKTTRLNLKKNKKKPGIADQIISENVSVTQVSHMWRTENLREEITVVCISGGNRMM